MAGRTWRIELPAGMPLLNANHRTHWRRKAERTRAIRQAAMLHARSALVPQLERAHVAGIYEPPDRRRRDPANLYPSFKAAIDGALVDAGVLPDDDSTHLDGPDMRLGEVHPGGRLVLVITELEAL